MLVTLNTRVKELEADYVILEDGQKLQANCVLDARGFEPNENVFLGYQKFVGRTIRTKEPHGLKRPIIMDATVAQLGGYRFVYCLPFTEHEVLVEDRQQDVWRCLHRSNAQSTTKSPHLAAALRGRGTSLV